VAIRGVLSQFPAIEKAVLFGSRATGTYSSASDIDLVLYGELLTLSDESRIASKLEDTDLPFRVDLVRYHTITSKALLSHIHHAGKLLYEVKSRRGKASQGNLGRGDEYRASATLRELLLTTKDGDWGKESPERGFVPYRVIRGTDFPGVRTGDTQAVPVRFLSEATVHRRTLVPDDILLETAGGSPGRPTGRSLLITEKLLSSLDLPATCASFARFLRVDPSKAVPRYIYWHLQFLYTSGQMEEHQVQHTGVARFQYTKFAETVQIPLPDPMEQRAIAHILGTLDDKIELNRRMNETLEAMARALFKSWFVAFDPVRAKAEGRDPGLPKPLSDLFPDSFEDSELGPVPCGWLPSKWGELVSLEYGKGLAGYNRADGAYAVYGTNGRIGTHSVALCPHSGIVVGRKGAYRGVHYSDAPFFVIDTAFYVTPKVPLQMRWAYYELLQMDINSMDSGSAIPSTSREDFYGVPVLAPPVQVQDCFVKLLGPMWLRQAQNEIESRTLTALRDTLLPKLISGELRVKGAERLVAESTP
jgi:type I restriction enzyme S subunit